MTSYLSANPFWAPGSKESYLLKTGFFVAITHDSILSPRARKYVEDMVHNGVFSYDGNYNSIVGFNIVAQTDDGKNYQENRIHNLEYCYLPKFKKDEFWYSSGNRTEHAPCIYKRGSEVDLCVVYYVDGVFTFSKIIHKKNLNVNGEQLRQEIAEQYFDPEDRKALSVSMETVYDDDYLSTEDVWCITFCSQPHLARPQMEDGWNNNVYLLDIKESPFLFRATIDRPITEDDKRDLITKTILEFIRVDLIISVPFNFGNVVFDTVLKQIGMAQ